MSHFRTPTWSRRFSAYRNAAELLAEVERIADYAARITDDIVRDRYVPVQKRIAICREQLADVIDALQETKARAWESKKGRAA